MGNRTSQRSQQVLAPCKLIGVFEMENETCVSTAVSVSVKVSSIKTKTVHSAKLKCTSSTESFDGSNATEMH